MDFAPIGLTPAARDLPSLAEREPSFSEYFSAQAGEALRASPVSSIYRATELSAANTDPLYYGQEGEAPQRLEADAVQAQAASKGVKLDNLGTSTYTQAAADIMIDRAQRRQMRQITIGAYGPNMGTALGVSLLASMADPLNVAAAFLPVVPEARATAMLAQASSGLSRAAVRAGIGALEGGVGAAAVEPFIALAATQEGQDYTLSQSLENLAFGTAFGAGLHAGFGALGDKLLDRRFSVEPPANAPELVDRLPVAANRAAISAAISDLVHGRKVQASDIVDGFIRNDPDLAEGISYAATLRRDGPEIDDVPARIAYWEGQLANRKSPTKPVPFMTWLRQQGGIRDVDGDIRDFVGDTAHLGKGYISPEGAKRTQRGLLFDDLYELAKSEGYVNTRQEFRDAFAKDSETLKANDRKARAEFETKEEHIKRMLAESGVNPNTKNGIKARAIAGREQHIVAAERARLNSVMDRLEARQDDYKTIAEGGKAEAVRRYEFTKPSGESESVGVGDVVQTTDETGSVNMSQGRKVASIIEDPVYGHFVTFEGDETKSAYPANQLQVLQRAPKEQPKPVESVKIEKPKPDEKTGQYTFEQFNAELRDAFELVRGSPVSIEAMKERLPGISDKQIRTFTDALQKSQDINGIITDKEKRRAIEFRRHFTDNELQLGKRETGPKVEQIRRNLDAQYPNMAKESAYYLSAFQNVENRDKVDLGLKGLQKYLNEEIRANRLRVINEDTRAVLDHVPSEYFDMDRIPDQPDLLVLFNKSTEPLNRPQRPESLLFPKGNPLNKSKSEQPTLSLPSSSSLFTPPIPTVEQLQRFSRVEKVDLNNARSTQTKMNWSDFNAGKHPGDLIEGYGDKPVAGKREDGEYLIFDGHHRVAKALSEGAKTLEMHVIDVKDYAPEAAGRKSSTKNNISDADLLAELSVPAEPPRIETPPAPVEQLQTAELAKATGEFNRLQQDSLRRLEALSSKLSPETAASLRVALDRTMKDADEYAKVVESAAQCLVKLT